MKRHMFLIDDKGYVKTKDFNDGNQEKSLTSGRQKEQRPSTQTQKGKNTCDVIEIDWICILFIIPLIFFIILLLPINFNVWRSWSYYLIVDEIREDHCEEHSFWFERESFDEGI